MKKKKGKPEAGPVEFEHRRSEHVHRPSDSITYREVRGARVKSTDFLFSDYEATFEYIDEHTGQATLETYRSFFEAANFWLKAAGEKDFFGVVDDAERASSVQQMQPQKDKAENFTFKRWAFEIGQRRGFLSPEAVAANFLAASDLLHRLVKDDEQLRIAVYQFAQAWHWMQFEALGEHELADIGLRSVAGRAQGPAAKKQRAEMKRAIAKEAYDEFASDEANGSRRTAAKSAAGALLGQINDKLRELRLDEFSDKKLQDELRPLIKARFPR
ncbi:hypothetical protein ABIA06_004578 [Bradyrhizobium yuanmingense]|uniref:hypothetical protein n=1 Tax=Bradyrhizobium yuanmingense TaxID=108015 RepID=UPI0035122CA4